STIGFERRFNPALQFGEKNAFVDFVLSDLPPQPPAFAENRRRNLEGEGARRSWGCERIFRSSCCSSSSTRSSAQWWASNGPCCAGSARTSRGRRRRT